MSGINHGSNLGDDITYSGTVAAALEAIVLGLPGIAVSQQSLARARLPRDRSSISRSRPLHGPAVADLAASRRPRHAPDVNVPGATPTAVEVARLGKRVYADELSLIEQESDRPQAVPDLWRR